MEGFTAFLYRESQDILAIGLGADQRVPGGHYYTACINSSFFFKYWYPRGSPFSQQFCFAFQAITLKKR